MNLRFISFLGAALFMSAALFASPRTFHGKVTADGKGVSSVAVTDGLNVVLTDSKGRYTLESDGTADFVYITRPASYALHERNASPCFYREVGGEESERMRVDFELEYLGTDETSHAVVVWADTQVYEEHEIDYLVTAAGDLKAHLAGKGIKSAVGLCCGDIIGQYPEDKDFFIPISEALRMSGIPFHYVLGNHDIDMSCPKNSDSKHPFKSLYGPSYYSFNVGQVHYIVLDNVFYMGGRYVGYIEERQLEWLENDLKYVPEGSTVMVSMHIPAYSREARRKQWGREEYNKITNNRRVLFEILKNHNVHLLTAHEHYAENFILSDKMMEHVHAPISGLFWHSLWSCDGIPWGYTVYEVDGQEVEWYYKPVGESGDRQFTAYGVGEDPMKPDAVVVNVWNYDPAWKVLWYEDGVLKGDMTKYSGWDRTICADVEARREKEFKWKYIGAGETEHLFYAVPSSPEKTVSVEVVDRFGNVYRWSSAELEVK